MTTKHLLLVDSCAVSDALDALGLPSSVLPFPRISGTCRIAARVHTVQLAPASSRGAPRHLAAEVLGRAGAGEAIVVAGGEGGVGAWGGLLTRAAMARGIVAAIADGACRDVDEIGALGFSVWARGNSPRSSRGRVVEAATDIEVTIEGCVIAPGDYVLADASGVVFVPQSQFETVLACAQEIAVREETLASRIAEGVAAKELFGASYERFFR